MEYKNAFIPGTKLLATPPQKPNILFLIGNISTNVLLLVIKVCFIRLLLVF